MMSYHSLATISCAKKRCIGSGSSAASAATPPGVSLAMLASTPR
jgi:hypothetical protein